eukprot:jgi/Botrbrau1/4406/Bobra.105_2s0048.1
MVSLLPFTSGGSKKEGGLRSRHRGSSGTNGGGGITSRLATLGGGGGGGSKGTLAPGRSIPNTILPTVQGGHLQIGAPTGKWQLVVVYRGKHDPVSKNYLASLQQIIYELDELGVEVVAVSGDGRERAEAFLESLRAATDAKEITFKVAYGLPLSEQQRWGLYVSEPRNIRETDQPFPEPALLLLNPDGELVIVDVSNSPFARPDLRILVEGIRYIQENDYPTRGTYGF